MGLFNWGKAKSDIDDADKSRGPVRRPALRDWTEDMVPNSTLLAALYHNTYPGLKLAGGLSFPAIAIPVYFMGLPIPVSDVEDEAAGLALDALHQRFITDEQQIHIQCHRDGTVWVWPKFNQLSGRPMWEFISDDGVVDIVKDLYTGDVVKVVTDEQIKVVAGQDRREEVRRIREFTTRDVSIRYEGGGSLQGLVNQRFRNTLGIMPIPFPNNADGGMTRGHSDLGRMLSDLKIYHDTELAQHQAIAKFRPKLVQQVKNVDDWLTQNAIDLSSLDISTVDLIFNLNEVEKSEFVSLESIADPYIATKKQTFHKLVQESGIPEICWGLKTEGNHASVEEQMGVLSKFVDDKKRQKQESYDRLWNATARLNAAGALGPDLGEIRVTWDQMDTVSAETKSKIFKSFADGITALAGSGTITLDQVWELWRENYPSITEEDSKAFLDGLRVTAEHKQFVSARYDEIRSALTGDEGGGVA